MVVRERQCLFLHDKIDSLRLYHLAFVTMLLYYLRHYLTNALDVKIQTLKCSIAPNVTNLVSHLLGKLNSTLRSTNTVLQGGYFYRGRCVTRLVNFGATTLRVERENPPGIWG